jgi:hypothetical protein
MHQPPPAPAYGRPAAEAPLNPFSAAIQRRADARPVECFDLAEFGFFLPLEKNPPRVGIRVPTKYEQDCARAEATKYVEALAQGTETLKGSEDLTRDALAGFIAYETCREMRETAEGSGVWEPTGSPAFMGPKWLCQRVEPERIAVLINLLNEVRAKHAPSPTEIDDSTVEAYASLCATADEPEYRMAGLSREYLCQLAVLLSVKLARERAEAAAREEEIASLRARLAVLEAAAAGSP